MFDDEGVSAVVAGTFQSRHPQDTTGHKGGMSNAHPLTYTPTMPELQDTTNIYDEHRENFSVTNKVKRQYQFLEAFPTAPTQRHALEKMGISESAFRRWLKEPLFARSYSIAKAKKARAQPTDTNN